MPPVSDRTLEDLLKRVASSNNLLEAKLRGRFSQLESRMDAMDFDTERVSNAVRQMELLSRAIKVVVVAVLPLLLTAAVTLVQSYQRQKDIEKQFDSYIERATLVEHELKGAQLKLETLKANGDHERKSIDEIKRILEKMNDVPKRRKRRR